MLLKIFNGRNTSLQYSIIIAIGIIFLILPVYIAPNNGFNPLYSLVYKLLNGNPWAIRITFGIIVISLLLLTQYYATFYGLFKRKHFQFLIIAPLFIFSSPWAWYLSPPLFSLLLMLIGVKKLFHLGDTEKVTAELSSSAIIFSISSLIYSIMFMNILLIIIALVVFRQFNVRHLFIVISSFILPYIYLFTWYFMTDELSIKWFEFINQFSSFSFMIEFGSNWADYIFIAIISILSIYTILTIIGNLRSKLIQIRGYTVFIIWALIMSVLLIFIAGQNTTFHYIIILFLLSFIFSIYLNDNKPNWILETAIILIIAQKAIIIFQMLYA